MGDIILMDRKILSQISVETSWEEVKALDLKSRLHQACKKAWTSGAGLAAIQIGVPLRFAWYVNSRGESQYLLNPVITSMKGEEIGKEGCLSIPNKWTMVKRAVFIEYTSGGKKKKANLFEARLIQHEIDHMNGILNDSYTKDFPDVG